jgi:hypothetical protein
MNKAECNHPSSMPYKIDDLRIGQSKKVKCKLCKAYVFEIRNINDRDYDFILIKPPSIRQISVTCKISNK